MKILAFMAVLFSFWSANAQHAVHNHHVALFAGATAHHSKTHTTVGIDYEYRLQPMWGVGLMAESISSDPNATIAAALLFLHPMDHLKFVLGAGQESVSSHNEGWKRLGVAYDFHVGEYSISPTVASDHLDNGNSSVVYGVSFGLGF